MPVRALENRVFTLTANRIGHEHRTATALTFIGNSRIISPNAEVLASCDDTTAAPPSPTSTSRLCDKNITPRNDLFADRRPEAYGLG